MRYPPAILDEIRARLPASEVVGKRVKLKKAGREWKGLSPFNAEKTPSFYVNDQKAFYHCFSSGKHGDIFTFLMETEGLSFPEAVERLAQDAGVALPRLEPEAREQEERRKGLHEVMELACAFYESALQGRFGLKAREYLGGRGLAGETQRAFRIGYAPPDRFSLRDHLAGKGVASELMIQAGLLVTGDDVKVPYDRFRDRVMFPICDVRGRVIAFGGRAMSADVPAKYLNSPETPLFDKGRLLYNLHRARKPAHERGAVIAVEGYVDVIAMTAAGFPHTVAPLGTALTEDQLALLWRMAEEPILCFDGDGAGRRAAYRAIDVALPVMPPGRSLRVALLPEGQDPDDLARAGGPAAVERVIAGARPLVDILWARETEAGVFDTPEKRANLERRLKESVGQIKDETLRRYYREEVEARLHALLPADRPRRDQGGQGGFAPSRDRRGYGGGRDPRGGGRDHRGGGSPGAGLRASPLLARTALFMGAGIDSPREALILGALIAHPDLLHGCAEALAELEFETRAARSLCSVLLDCAADGAAPDPAVVEARLARLGLVEAARRLPEIVRPGDRWALDPHADRMRLEDALRQAFVLHRRAHTLHSELQAAEKALAEEESEVNLVWLREVKNQLSSLEGAEAEMDGPQGRDLDGSG